MKHQAKMVVVKDVYKRQILYLTLFSVEDIIKGLLYSLDISIILFTNLLLLSLYTNTHLLFGA